MHIVHTMHAYYACIIYMHAYIYIYICACMCTHAYSYTYIYINIICALLSNLCIHGVPICGVIMPADSSCIPFVHISIDFSLFSIFFIILSLISLINSFLHVLDIVINIKKKSYQFIVIFHAFSLILHWSTRSRRCELGRQGGGHFDVDTFCGSLPFVTNC